MFYWLTSLLLAFWELQFYFQEIAKHPMEIYFNFVVLNLF